MYKDDDHINCKLEGCITALVTPFLNNEVDYVSFKKLIDFQLKQGINNFVVNGTTGEATTLNLSEKRSIVKYVIENTPENTAICAGVSSNDTAKMLKEIENIEDLNVEYLLISTPYYNKTTQKGLIEHINKAVETTNKKIILYNIPSRAGMSFSVETICKLAENKQIVAIKEASGDISYLQELVLNLADKLAIYSGNDDLAYVYATLGAKGVISAVGNIYGYKYNDMYNYINNNDFKSANNINLETLVLSKMLFDEINPILIKGLLSRLGIIENELRLPLVNSDVGNIEILYNEYIKLK